MEIEEKIKEHFKFIRVSLNERELMIAEIGWRIGERNALGLNYDGKN